MKSGNDDDFVARLRALLSPQKKKIRQVVGELVRCVEKNVCACEETRSIYLKLEDCFAAPMSSPILVANTNEVLLATEPFAANLFDRLGDFLSLQEKIVTSLKKVVQFVHGLLKKTNLQQPKLFVRTRGSADYLDYRDECEDNSVYVVMNVLAGKLEVQLQNDLVGQTLDCVNALRRLLFRVSEMETAVDSCYDTVREAGPQLSTCGREVVDVLVGLAEKKRVQCHGDGSVMSRIQELSDRMYADDNVNSSDLDDTLQQLEMLTPSDSALSPQMEIRAWDICFENNLLPESKSEHQKKSTLFQDISP